MSVNAFEDFEIIKQLFDSNMTNVYKGNNLN